MPLSFLATLPRRAPLCHDTGQFRHTDARAIAPGVRRFMDVPPALEYIRKTIP